MQKKLDGLGRVHLPKSMRDSAGFAERETVEVSYDEETQIFSIKRAERKCSVCGKTEDLKDFNNVILCKNCIKNIKNS